VSIGANVTVGAGAAVIADVADGAVVVGVPARPLQKREGS
jgi:serine acetyltransferase